MGALRQNMERRLCQQRCEKSHYIFMALCYNHVIMIFSPIYDKHKKMLPAHFPNCAMAFFIDSFRTFKKGKNLEVFLLKES